jgi:predicted enzyme related to lactoylglutathione lyase
MNLGFVVLYVQDLAKVQAFYTEVLGLAVVEAVSSPTFVTLRPAEGSLLALQDKAAARFPPKEETRPGSVELSFAVEDVDGTWHRWQEQGVELLGEPVDLSFGRYFMAKDPEGHYLSVYRFNPPGAVAPDSAPPSS